ncbi:DNA-directed RNA polymerase subunit B'' [Archaeoglobales archaeon]|nr:MAG: DNA-directed RNA polymerase subunit B'' [Archaeoglobales archaeon]
MNETFLTLLNTFVKEKGLVRYQIDSYNDFVARRIPKVLKEIGVIKPDVPELGDFKIKLGEFSIGQPSVKEADGSVRNILPLEARMRNLTYAAPMYVEMTPVLNNIESETTTVNFGDLPVMVKSNICPLSTMSRQELIEVGEDPEDPGGYFIINGTERILVLVEEIAPNRIITEKVDSGNVTEIARIHSEKEGYVQRHLLERKRDGIITISFVNVTRLPVAILLKALGLESDKDIITAISLDPEVQEEFYVNLYEAEVATQEEALEAIGKHLKIPQKDQRISRAKRLIDRYLLPHLGQKPENRLEKALFLAKAISKILRLHLGKIEEDDLDHYSNKRLRLAGDLLEILLRSILLGKWGLITRITYNYQKLTKRGRLPPLQAIVESNVLTNQIVSALAIGTWVGGRTGVSQRLERGSYVKTLSHMRNVLSPLTSTQEHFEARELHPTHWGKLCTSETPEGATIGLRKYLAIFAEVTKGANEKEVKVLENSIKNWVK